MCGLVLRVALALAVHTVLFGQREQVAQNVEPITSVRGEHILPTLRYQGECPGSNRPEADVLLTSHALVDITDEKVLKFGHLKV